MNGQTINTFVIAGLTIVVGILAGYVKSFWASYGAKKGERLATNEDLKSVLNEVRTVTQATKEIEAKISDQVWSRQRRWELRRDAAFEAIREIGTMQDILIKSVAATKRATERNRSDPTDCDKRFAPVQEEFQRFKESMARFQQKRSVMLLAFGDSVLLPLNELEAASDRVMNISTEPPWDDDEVTRRVDRFVRAYASLSQLLRDNLDNL